MSRFKIGDEVRVVDFKNSFVGVEDYLQEVNNLGVIAKTDDKEYEADFGKNSFVFFEDEVELVNKKSNTECTSLDYKKEYEQLRQVCGELEADNIIMRGIIKDLGFLLNK